ncbi:LysR family transcriptional regulator [Vibrio inusitatus NBRC 102082]|uniref:LysR family transcriptional regulator n=1 Tax=Vibrio inusitatus NBRC 102082 TaxID=1219070 RepID=A0A4Y3HV94_9VIBR|nr:LysR family transcriptional regulator [Vibrio inusitatus]GEA50977.1 LysR family transcriptional regulator [Vibrio inusitatus NBRC 102082]
MKTHFDDLWMFTQAVLHGGISAAANANGLQRSKVSRRIQTLEESLGCELLIRTTRTIELTGPGKHLYQLAYEQMYNIEQGIKAMKESHQDYVGVLRLAVPSALMTSQVFNSIITEYSSKFPNVQLEVENHQGSIDLKRQGFDLQVLPEVVTITDESYVQFSLQPYQSHLVASQKYLDSHPPCETLADLKSHRIFANRYNAKLLGKDIPIHLKSDDLNLMYSLALKDKGIAFLPKNHSLTSIGYSPLIQVLPNAKFPSLNLTLIYPSSKNLSKKTRALISIFKEKIA